jgi:hypothetical protein
MSSDVGKPRRLRGLVLLAVPAIAASILVPLLTKQTASLAFRERATRIAVNSLTYEETVEIMGCAPGWYTNRQFEPPRDLTNRILNKHHIERWTCDDCAVFVEFASNRVAIKVWIIDPDPRPNIIDRMMEFVER